MSHAKRAAEGEDRTIFDNEKRRSEIQKKDQQEINKKLIDEVECSPGAGPRSMLGFPSEENRDEEKPE